MSFTSTGPIFDCHIGAPLFLSLPPSLYWIEGKRDKIRFIPVHPLAERLIQKYLMMAGHGNDVDGALFRAREEQKDRGGLATVLAALAEG
jgi:hypothetical protein